MNSVITLTTDFGIASTYVAQMKGVILGICGNASIVDNTHAVTPQDLRLGSLALAESAFHFPANTIHIAVVDPGVGTTREILYVSAGDQQFILPDNGLISEVATQFSPDLIVRVSRPEYWNKLISKTFHGRDIMSPVAAHIANGVAPTELGETCESFELLPPSLCEVKPNGAKVQVLTIDSFGNVVTSLRPDLLPAHTELVRASSLRQPHPLKLRRVHTYAEADSGGLIILPGSGGYVEIAQVNSNAARALDLGVDDEIELEWDSEEDLN